MNKQTKKLLGNRGFTLIEVLITIVIIGILSAVTVLSYKGYVKSSNEAATKQEMSQLSQVYEVGIINGDFDSTGTYDYEQLKTAYNTITGYTLPFSETELSFASNVLTLVKRDVTVKYDFTTKSITVQ